jgi:hypothetical protein
MIIKPGRDGRGGGAEGTKELKRRLSSIMEAVKTEIKNI